MILEEKLISILAPDEYSDNKGEGYEDDWTNSDYQNIIYRFYNRYFSWSYFQKYARKCYCRRDLQSGAGNRELEKYFLDLSVVPEKINMNLLDAFAYSFEHSRRKSLVKRIIDFFLGSEWRADYLVNEKTMAMALYAAASEAKEKKACEFFVRNVPPLVWAVSVRNLYLIKTVLRLMGYRGYGNYRDSISISFRLRKDKLPYVPILKRSSDSLSYEHLLKYVPIQLRINITKEEIAEKISELKENQNIDDRLAERIKNKQAEYKLDSKLENKIRELQLEYKTGVDVEQQIIQIKNKLRIGRKQEEILEKIFRLTAARNKIQARMNLRYHKIKAYEFIREYNYVTPLIMACKNGDIETALFLLNLDANVYYHEWRVNFLFEEDQKHKTAYDYAKEKNMLENNKFRDALYFNLTKGKKVRLWKKMKKHRQLRFLDGIYECKKEAFEDNDGSKVRNLERIKAQWKMTPLERKKIYQKQNIEIREFLYYGNSLSGYKLWEQSINDLDKRGM